MQFGKEFVRRNSFYKCVINEEEGDLDSADVFEVRVVSPTVHIACVLESWGWRAVQIFTEDDAISMCICLLLWYNSDKKMAG